MFIITCVIYLIGGLVYAIFADGSPQPWAIRKNQETEENEITKAYNLELETIIKTKPEFWIWSHKRWKHKPPQHDEN